MARSPTRPPKTADRAKPGLSGDRPAGSRCRQGWTPCVTMSNRSRASSRRPVRTAAPCFGKPPAATGSKRCNSWQRPAPISKRVAAISGKPKPRSLPGASPPIAVTTPLPTACAGLEQHSGSIRPASLGDGERVEALLAKRPTLVDEPVDGGVDAVGLRPAHYAVAGGYRDILATLLTRGADICSDGERLVAWALDLETPDILRQLLDHGAKPRRGDANEACLDPFWAPVLATYGYTADINAPDRLGFPPLVEACRGNHNAAEGPPTPSPIS